MGKPVAEGWVTTDEGAALTGYAAAYVRRLAAEGKVEARRVSRIWLVRRDALLAHKAAHDALGRQRHNPWRPELIARGRGRRPKI